MKILLISLSIDKTTGSAVILGEDKFREIVISKKLLEIISSIELGLIDLRDAVGSKKLAKLVRLYGDYEHVIICNDGKIKVIK